MLPSVACSSVIPLTSMPLAQAASETLTRTRAAVPSPPSASTASMGTDVPLTRAVAPSRGRLMSAPAMTSNVTSLAWNAVARTTTMSSNGSSSGTDEYVPITLARSVSAVPSCLTG